LCFIFRKRDVFEDKEVPLTEDKEFSSEDKGIVNDAQIAQNQNHEDKYENAHNIAIDHAVAVIDNVAEENEVVFDINDVELMPINLSRWMDFQAQDEELNDVQDLDNYLALDNICVNSALLRLEFANVAETLLDVLDGE
jgi:hypothetical protein